MFLTSMNYVYIYSQRTLSPFCDVLQDVGPPVMTCSVDRDLFSECSLIEFSPGQVPLEFQVLYHAVWVEVWYKQVFSSCFMPTCIHEYHNHTDKVINHYTNIEMFTKHT